MKYPFPSNPVLTAIAVAYRNAKGIADSVFPRVPVGAMEFSWTKYTKSDSFTLIDSKVGRKSSPNEVEFGGTNETSSVEDYGLEDPIPNRDILAASQSGLGFDPVGQATEMLSDLIELDRERRVAAMVFDPDNYATGNKSDLAAVDQWDESGGDPLGDIEMAMDSMLVRPNIAVMGSRVASVLRAHPTIVAAAFPLGGNAADGGRADLGTLANLLGLDEILIGRGWINTAARGQDAVYSRVWNTNDLALLVRNQQVLNTKTVTFGLTAQWGGRIAGSFEDKNIGLRGGTRVRVGESVKELVVAEDLGYLFENVVSAGVIGS